MRYVALLFLGLLAIALPAQHTLLGSRNGDPVPGQSRDGDPVQDRDDEPAPSLEHAVRRYYAGAVEDAAAELQAVLDRLSNQSADSSNQNGTGEWGGSDERDVRHNLALLLLELGRHDEAIRQLQKMRDTHASAHGWALALAGRHEEAAVALVEAGENREESAERTAQQLFWRGISERDAGNSGAAIATFEGAIDHDPRHAYSHYFLGRLHLENQDWHRGIAALERALQLDANLTTAFEPLAQARVALGETEAAYALLSRAVVSLPWNDAVRLARSELERDHPELVARREAEVAGRRREARAPRVAALPADAADAPDVRVGLAEDLAVIHLKPGAAWQLFDETLDEAVARGERDAVLLVEHAGVGTVNVSIEDGPEIFHGGGPLELRLDEPDATTMVFDLEYGHGQFRAGREDRSYRGTLRILTWADRGFTVVNRVNVEAYLLSVVPSEMPAGWPHEALAAQAVAARSYTLAPRSRFHERGFDLLGSVLSAFYRGVGGEHPRTTQAVEATIGLVLMDGRTPLNAVYSANSAGYTESSRSVWGFESALVGVSDRLLPRRDAPPAPFELAEWLLERPRSHSNHPRYSSFSAYRWSRWVSHDELVARLDAGDLGRIQAVITRGRGTSGRVERVEVVGTERAITVERDAIRSRLGGLRSNLFTVYPKLSAGDEAGPDGEVAYFVFSGAGWGHGVGMDQSGAAGMADAGYSAEEILQHYYPRAALEKRY